MAHSWGNPPITSEPFSRDVKKYLIAFKQYKPRMRMTIRYPRLGRYASTATPTSCAGVARKPSVRSTRILVRGNRLSRMGKKERTSIRIDKYRKRPNSVAKKAATWTPKPFGAGRHRESRFCACQ